MDDLRRPTMEDVAKRAGVSRALVSIVFRDASGASDSARARVRRAAADLGYVPDRRASRLGRSRTRMIGVVFALSGDFHAEVIDGMYVAAGIHGYEVVLGAVTRRRGEADAIRALLSERCEGVVLIGPQMQKRSIAELAERVPTVVLLRTIRLPSLDVIRTDDDAGMASIVDHLVALGHTRILHIDGGSAAGSVQRRNGYRKAMRCWGLDPIVASGGPSEESGVRAAGAVLEEPVATRPTAIAAFNDRCALGVMHELMRHTVHIPNELSLVGFDDIAAARHPHISLTTVRQDADTLARLAVQRLRERLEEGRPPDSTEHRIRPQLIVRRTTMAPGRPTLASSGSASPARHP